MTDVRRIDELLETPCWLIDIFPCTVPETTDRRYFLVEEYFQEHRAGWDEAFCNLLLKLYCYYDFQVSTGGDFAENPEPRRLAEWIRRCFAGDWRKRGSIHIILPECNAMLILNGGDLYMTLYHPDEALRELTARLAGAEGLFFYRAPGA